MLRDTVVHLLRDNFTEAKIRGKKRYLLERQQLQSLTKFKSQTEVIGFLADSPYGPELSKLPDAASPAEGAAAISRWTQRPRPRCDPRWGVRDGLPGVGSRSVAG